jgi:WD40 repeat protein
LWNLKTGDAIRLLKEEDEEPKPFSGVALSNDPTMAVAVSRNRLYVWNIKRGELVQSFSAHKSFIGTLALTDSGTYALTATPSGTIKLWDIMNVQCIRSLKGFSPTALSSDGHIGISGNNEGKVQIWAIHATHDTFAAPFMICHSAEVPRSDDKSDASQEKTPQRAESFG